MNGQDFIRIINEAYASFLEQLGFEMDEPSVSGRYYRAKFTGTTNAVWVSYEPGDEVFFVMVFGLRNGELSDIDDPIKTPRLADLNSRYMSSVSDKERADNEIFFRHVKVHDEEARFLLRAAKELRLVLPKYLRDVGP